jgi:NADH dehydrogenase
MALQGPLERLSPWATWLTVHIFFLIGFRNRLSVFAAWIWTYFTFTRGARLITGDQRLPGWQDQVAAGPTDPPSSSSNLSS